MAEAERQAGETRIASDAAGLGRARCSSPPFTEPSRPPVPERFGARDRPLRVLGTPTCVAAVVAACQVYETVNTCAALSLRAPHVRLPEPPRSVRGACCVSSSVADEGECLSGGGLHSCTSLTSSLSTRERSCWSESQRRGDATRVGIADLESHAGGILMTPTRVVHREDECVRLRQLFNQRIGEMRR